TCILSHVSDDILKPLALVNKYCLSIYTSNDLWVRKVLVYFPTLPRKWMLDKGKEVYLSLKNIDFDHFEIINRAIFNGDLLLLQWVAEDSGIYPDKDQINDASKKGYLDIVKWIAANTGLYPSYSSLMVAMENGHIDILKWVSQNNPKFNIKDPIGEISLGDCCIHTAAYSGGIEYIQWIMDNFGIKPNNVTLVGAISNKCLDVVKWLVENTDI